MKTSLLLLPLLLVPVTAFATPKRSAQRDPVGVGAVVGDPTGVSAKYKLYPNGSIDGVVGIPTGNALYGHVDYLYEGKPFGRISRSSLSWFAGGGLRTSVYQTRASATGNGNGKGKKNQTARETNSDFGVGVRVPAGLELRFDKLPRLEVFGEAALDIGLVNSPDWQPQLGLGARWYF